MRAGMLHSSYPPGWHPWAWLRAAKLIPGFKGVLDLPEPLGGPFVYCLQKVLLSSRGFRIRHFFFTPGSPGPFPLLTVRWPSSQRSCAAPP